jgi:hypothetical protein
MVQVQQNTGCDVETHVADSAVTVSLNSGDIQNMQDLLRFGHGRYRRLELIIQGLKQHYTIASHEIQDIIIGRQDKRTNFCPYIDLTELDVQNLGVSRRHATINNQRGLLFITDHHSPNGTYVNGQRIVSEEPHVLTNGDTLHIGRVCVQIHFIDKVLTT